MPSDSVVLVVFVSYALHPMVLVPKALHTMLFCLMLLPPIAWFPMVLRPLAFSCWRGSDGIASNGVVSIAVLINGAVSDGIDFTGVASVALILIGLPPMISFFS